MDAALRVVPCFRTLDAGPNAVQHRNSPMVQLLERETLDAETLEANVTTGRVGVDRASRLASEGRVRGACASADQDQQDVPGDMVRGLLGEDARRFWAF